MQPKLTVLHINTERGFRGGEIQTLHLIKGLNERGHQNVLAVQKNSPLIQQAKQASIVPIEINMRGEWDLVAAFQLRKLIKQHRPDILHAHTAHATSLALTARTGKNIATVFTRRVTLPIPRNPFARKKYNSVDGIIAVSKSVKAQLIETGVEADKICIAESGTDFSRLDDAPAKNVARKYLQIPEDSFVIGNVSYFDANKGQYQLIQAFTQFAAAHPEKNNYLLLVGDGPELERCRVLAKRSRLGERVIFAGMRLDIKNLYAAMDVFFLSSLRGEGWSGVLREAMGMSLPCIAVDQPATCDQLQNDNYGLLVSNRILNWVQAIERLYEDPELQTKIGKQGNEAARKFSIESMVEKTEACYYKVLERINSRSN
jgi:glycosyltransferase involved in cell wall biosynthesis